MRLARQKRLPTFLLSVQSRASTDRPAPTCASPARWSVNAAGADLAPATKGDAHGPRTAVLERLPQAFARVLPDRPLHRDISDRTGVIPADQQENRQPTPAAAG